MSNIISSTPLLDLLTEDLMMLYGCLQHSDVTYDINNGNITIQGVNIVYDIPSIGEKISLIDNLINENKENDEEIHLNMITMLDDIKNVLHNTQERLSWLP